MKIRYKVIKLWPGSGETKIGQVLTLSDRDTEAIKVLNDHPHLFKKLKNGFIIITKKSKK